MVVFLQQIPSVLEEEREKYYKKILYYSVNYHISASPLAQPLSCLATVGEYHVRISGSRKKDWRGTVSPRRTGSDLIHLFSTAGQNCRGAIQAHSPLPADPAGLSGRIHLASPAPRCYLPSPPWGNASSCKCPHKVRCCLNHHCCMHKDEPHPSQVPTQVEETLKSRMRSGLPNSCVLSLTMPVSYMSWLIPVLLVCLLVSPTNKSTWFHLCAVSRRTPCTIKSCLPFSYGSSSAGLSTASFSQVGKYTLVPEISTPLRSWIMEWSEDDQTAGAIVYTLFPQESRLKAFQLTGTFMWTGNP